MFLVKEAPPLLCEDILAAWLTARFKARARFKAPSPLSANTILLAQKPGRDGVLCA